MPRQSRFPFAVALLALATGCQKPGVSSAAPGTGGSGGTAETGGGTRMDAGFVIPGNRDGGPGGGGGGAPGAGLGEGQCAATVNKAMQVPVDLLLLVDTSGSLDQPAQGSMRSKWELVVEAFKRFMSDPRSSGLGMGLQLMPVLSRAIPCNVENDCPDSNPGRALPPGFPGFCREHSFCVGGTVPRDLLVPCVMAQAGCPAGASCKPGGACSISGRDCAVGGQPCPGATAGDICQTISSGKSCIPRRESCEPGHYQQPAVPIADLPGNEMLLNTAFGARKPYGQESMGPAIKGAVTYLRKWQMDHPGRKPVLVLTSDGVPTNCDPFDVPSLAAEIAAARMGSPSIPTYAIGVFSPWELREGRMTMEAFAAAGGTGMPFVIEANGNLTMRLQEALAQIRGSVLPCEFVIPPSATGQKLDYGKVNVKFKGTATPDETVPYVERADRCDPTRGGWYYDVHPTAGTPTRVLACEASCRKFKADAGGTVSLAFGCATEVIQ